jgi:hypothetical protein
MVFYCILLITRGIILPFPILVSLISMLRLVFCPEDGSIWILQNANNGVADYRRVSFIVVIYFSSQLYS